MSNFDCFRCHHCREIFVDHFLVTSGDTGHKLCLPCIDYFLSRYTDQCLKEFHWTDKLSILLDYEFGLAPPEFCGKGTQPGECARILNRIHAPKNCYKDLVEAWEDHQKFLEYRGEFQDFGDWINDQTKLANDLGEGVLIKL